MKRTEFKEILQIISSDLRLTEEHDLDLCEWGKKVKRVAVNAWELQGEARGQYIQCPMGQIYGGSMRHSAASQISRHKDSLYRFPGLFDSYMNVRLNRGRSIEFPLEGVRQIVEIIDD